MRKSHLFILQPVNNLQVVRPVKKRRGDAETPMWWGLNRLPIESHQIADFDGGLRPLGLIAQDTGLGTHPAPRPRIPVSPRHLVELRYYLCQM